jgi:hypothetical protein
VDAMPHTFVPFHEASQRRWEVRCGNFGVGGPGYRYAVEEAPTTAILQGGELSIAKNTREGDSSASRSPPTVDFF